MTTHPSFRHWLQTQLEQRGWSMSELARRCDVSHPTISRFMSGKRDISSDVVRAIAHALEMPEEQLFRQAGLLSPLPAPEDDPTLTRLQEIALRLPAAERQELLDYAQWRYSLQQQEEDTP